MVCCLLRLNPGLQGSLNKEYLQGVKVRQAARNGERKEAPLLVPAAEVGGVVRPMQQVEQGVPWPEL